MSIKEELLTALGTLRSELISLTLRIDELEARVNTLDTFEIVGAAPTTPPRTESSIPSDAERAEAARQTGQFFKRALLGQGRGESGRSRVKLQSRIYVVIRTFSGSVHTDPVGVYTHFSAVKAIVAEGGKGNQFGDSIFAGFPSIWEAKAAVEEAGFGWPSSYN